MQKFLLFLFIIFSISCSSNNAENNKTVEPQKVLGQSVNSETFNKSFSTFLNDYYKLKDAFVKEDTAVINASAKQIQISVDSLKLNELKADSLIIKTAKLYVSNLSDELKGLVKETDINNKRKSFQIVTSDMYDIIRTVKFDREKVYLQHCPMAFKNTGADWLSNSNEIVNPYLPKMMIDCGVLKDSIDFRN